MNCYITINLRWLHQKNYSGKAAARLTRFSRCHAVTAKHVSLGRDNAHLSQTMPAKPSLTFRGSSSIHVKPLMPVRASTIASTLVVILSLFPLSNTISVWVTVITSVKSELKKGDCHQLVTLYCPHTPHLKRGDNGSSTWTSAAQWLHVWTSVLRWVRSDCCRVSYCFTSVPH